MSPVFKKSRLRPSVTMASHPGSGMGKLLLPVLLMSASAAGQWQNIFSKPRAFSLSKANLLTTLTKVPKEFRLSFEFLPSGYTARHRSLLHLSTGRAQDKMPELTVGSSSIKVESRIGGKNVKNNLRPPPPEGQWTKIQVEQQVSNGKYEFSITIGSKTTVLTRDNKNPEEFLGVKVYSGSPWASPAAGQIRKLLVESKVDATGGEQSSFSHVLSGCGNCVFPFIFGGRIHTTCTTMDGDSTPWCSTKVSSSPELLGHHPGGQQWRACVWRTRVRKLLCCVSNDNGHLFPNGKIGQLDKLFKLSS